MHITNIMVKDGVIFVKWLARTIEDENITILHITGR